MFALPWLDFGPGLPKTCPMANQSKYQHQRERVVPPHISLRTLRVACKLTLDQVCALVEEETGRPLTRGALSAIESGLRGASDEIIRGLAHAYDIKPEDIDTKYQPRVRAA